MMLRHSGVQVRTRTGGQATDRGRWRKRTSFRGLALLGVLAGLGIALVPSAAATGGSVKKYDACLQIGGAPACFSPKVASGLPAGAKVELLLTIKNQLASSVKLGSANLTAPAALPIDTGTVASPPARGRSARIRLPDPAPQPLPEQGADRERPLHGHRSMFWERFRVDDLRKGEERLLGFGVFTLINQTGLTSNIVGSCKLAWDTEPASAAKDATITGEPYDTNGDVVSREGGRRQRQPDDHDRADGDSGAVCRQLLGNRRQLSGGAATFTNFKGAQTGTGFKVDSRRPRDSTRRD